MEKEEEEKEKILMIELPKNSGNDGGRVVVVLGSQAWNLGLESCCECYYQREVLTRPRKKETEIWSGTPCLMEEVWKMVWMEGETTTTGPVRCHRSCLR